jgi:hypothetical protein
MISTDADGAPEMPPWLRGSEARAAFTNGYRACIVRGDWHEIYAAMLAVMANCAGLHVRLQREMALLDPATISPELRATAAETRAVARRAMAEMQMISKSAIERGTIRADGIDADIAALCDVPGVQ